jgi:hypothetical protein
MFKEKDVIDLNTYDDEDKCMICETHDKGYEFFHSREFFDTHFKEIYDKTKQGGTEITWEEMIDHVKLCPVCNKPLLSGHYSLGEHAVITTTNYTNPDGPIMYGEIYNCENCNKIFTPMMTEVQYNANHDICYTGGPAYLTSDDETLLFSKIYNLMTGSIEQYTDRIRNNDNLQPWHLELWIKRNIEAAISEFLFEKGYKK